MLNRYARCTDIYVDYNLLHNDIYLVVYRVDLMTLPEGTPCISQKSLVLKSSRYLSDEVPSEHEGISSRRGERENT